MPATRPPSISSPVPLSASNRERLYEYAHRGHNSARTRSQVLLKLGDGWSDAGICQALDVFHNTVKQVRTHFAAWWGGDGVSRA